LAGLDNLDIFEVPGSIARVDSLGSLLLVEVCNSRHGQNASLNREELSTNLNAEMTLEKLAFPTSGIYNSYQCVIVKPEGFSGIRGNRESVGIWGSASKIHHVS
jgi:hypothetical protein